MNVEFFIITLLIAGAAAICIAAGALGGLWLGVLLAGGMALVVGLWLVRAMLD